MGLEVECGGWGGWDEREEVCGGIRGGDGEYGVEKDGGGLIRFGGS